jgi:predicted nucleotidyltransferase
MTAMQILNKTDVISRIQHVLPDLKRKYPIKTLGLFGSYVRNEATAQSDVDILVDFNGKIDLFGYLQLEEDLAKATGIKTDLVTRSGLKAALKDRILSQVENIL